MKKLRTIISSGVLDQEEIDAQIAAAFAGSKKKKKKVISVEEPIVVDNGDVEIVE
jgi:hypothetical protein